MEHLFKEHSKRNTNSLNGEWKFRIDRDNQGIENEWFKEFPEDFRYLAVPGCWNNQIDIFNYFGVAWYSKEFICNAGELVLEFAGVSGRSSFYLDGEYLGEHYGGWTACSFAANVEQGLHTVTVRIDSTNNSQDTIPMREVDWYNYAGIIRGVYATVFTKPYITHHRIEYKLNESLTEADVTVSFVINNPFGGEYKSDVNVYINDEFITNAECKSGKIKLNAVTVKDIKLWDIGKPNLYTVRIVTEDDDLTEQIGFREIETSGDKILLNKKPIFLKGVNRHEEHPDCGFAVPLAINKRDVEIIKDLGCNTVRGSHYPNSQSFVDCLDREGILFWSEIPMWGCMPKMLGNPLMAERGIQMHGEMIEQYYHHPSIIIWGLHNEVYTDSQEGYDLTKRYSEFVRGSDDSRLVTYATCRFDKDICLEFVDFVALNYYMGWYSGSFSDWNGFIHGIRAEMIKKGVGDKPVILSEFGCAAIYGYSNFSADKWTMQYQSEMLEKVISLCKDEDGFAGTLVWQFADIRSDININRARSFNNKGLLDEYRRPKMSYYTVKKLYSSIK